MKNFTITFFLISCLFIFSCKKDKGSSNSCVTPGNKWTYRVIGNSYMFSEIVEAVSNGINGYAVYRLRRSDSPTDLGEYIHCKDGKKLWIASDSWDVNNPSNQVQHVFSTPIPVDLCPHGTPVGSIDSDASAVGTDDRTEYKVVAYESVTVPAGNFQNAEKLLVTHYDNGSIDDNLSPTYRWIDKNAGLLKELEVSPGPEVGIELVSYKR